MVSGMSEQGKDALWDRFIHVANIARFKDLLRTETDQAKRKVLQELLREEEAKRLAVP
jgi:hypothetical protein